MMAATDFGAFLILLLTSRPMFVLATLMGLIQEMSGTPYSHGYSPAGTDCSGLASLVSNVATERPAFAGRFNTGNEERALLARGFQYGTAPGALVIGWNGGHTAVTLPDGTPVSSGEGGGVRIGGGGAYQPQFTHHMYLPVDPGAPDDAPPPPFGPVLVNAVAPAPDAAPEPPPPPAPGPDPVEPVHNELPPPDPAPAPDQPAEAT
ncbi:peptidoglycan endopeptidase [Mycobacterium sp.]|uniref:peptidoglycan endopeptidase n=1 Tax=Mycobacterium sp. TaxID=1785 RepID=UPI0039C9C87B